jgi:hypothetical protein
MTRVILIFTTAGDAFSIMSAKEFESWFTRCVFVSACADTIATGEFVREATAKAAIRPPPTDAATSVNMAVVRRNWTTLDMFSKNPFFYAVNSIAALPSFGLKRFHLV